MSPTAAVSTLILPPKQWKLRHEGRHAILRRMQTRLIRPASRVRLAGVGIVSAAGAVTGTLITLSIIHPTFDRQLAPEPAIGWHFARIVLTRRIFDICAAGRNSANPLL
jgi:hypothetical protein